MAEAEPQAHDETSNEATESSDGEHESAQACHETVDPETREDVLDEYGFRCQACGRRGPEKGGLATLHVHHIERDPDGMDEHDMENLTLLCRPCHSWLHQQSTPADAPVEITDEDRSVLLPQDIEVLRYLAAHGPTRTGDIAAALTTDLTVSAIRERLWVLMGLDNRVESRDQQVVDKDIETGEWGLTDQIENSARGHIPDDRQLLLQRMEDEQVRRALDRGCDRRAVMEVLGISRRSTFNKVKRAYAYDFPLDAFSRGGRPAAEAGTGPGSTADESVAGKRNDQQRLDDVTNRVDGEVGRTETWGNAETGGGGQESSTNGVGETSCGDGGSDEFQRQLQQAIDALQEIDETL